MKKNSGYISIGPGIGAGSGRGRAFLASGWLETALSAVLMCTGTVGIMLGIDLGFFHGRDIFPAVLLACLAGTVVLVLMNLKVANRCIIPVILLITGSVILYLLREPVFEALKDDFYLIYRYIVWYVTGYDTVETVIVDELTDLRVQQLILAISLPCAVMLAAGWRRRSSGAWAVAAGSLVFTIFFASGYMPDFFVLVMILMGCAGVVFKVRTPEGREGRRFSLRSNSQMIAFLGVILVSAALSGPVFGMLNSRLSPIQEMVYERYYTGRGGEMTDPDANADVGGGISGGILNIRGGNRFDDDKVALNVRFSTATKASTYIKYFVADTYHDSTWSNTKGIRESEYEDIYDDLDFEYRWVDYVKNYSSLFGNPVPFVTKSFIELKKAEGENDYLPMVYAGHTEGAPGKQTGAYYLKDAGKRSIEYKYMFYDKGYEPGGRGSFFDFLKPFRREIVNTEPFDRQQQFAMENYLDVPDELSDLRNIFSQYDFGTDLESAIEFVQASLYDGFTYTKVPGVLPENEDYINFFYFKNKKGYCMHFASAAVMMFRSMGIPSRYVEGILVGPQEDAGWTEVKASHYHAWAEIYVPGYGWIPVEVTKAVLTEDGFEAIVDETEAPKPTDEPERPTVPRTVSPRESTSAAETTRVPATATAPGGSGKAETDSSGVLRVILIGIAVILAVLAIPVIVALISVLAYSSGVKRSRHKEFPVRARLSYRRTYRYSGRFNTFTAEGDAEKIAEGRDISAEKVRQMQEILLRSEFGRESITGEECLVLEKCEEAFLADRLRKTSGPRRTVLNKKLQIRRKYNAGE